MIRATVHDCRKLGFCLKQVRRWMSGMGFDFRSFVKEGIDVTKLEATDDAYALAVAREANRRVAENE